jgi:hypothetical protein
MSEKVRKKDSVLIKGLNRDIAHDKYPDGQITFALNAIMEDFKGNMGSISSEPGNSLFHTLDPDYFVIGTINLNRQDTILISTNNTTTEIGISKSNSSYQTLIKSVCFGYTKTNYVKGLFRLLNGCDRIIYLIDGVNPDKAINLDQLQNYHTSDTITEANALDTWNCTEMNIQPTYKTPYLSDFQVSEAGGSLKLGSYSIAVEILDDGLNRISLTHLPTQVIIYDDNINASYRDIDGGLNLETAPATIGGVPESTKSIRFSIENLDTNFTYYRIYVLRKSIHDGASIEVFKKGELNNIRGTSDIYTLSTVSSETGDERSNLDDIFIPPTLYQTSKEIIEIDNRLVRANVKSKTRDYSNYQRVVNNWEVKYTVKQANMKDPNSVGNPKNPETYDNGLSFMGDEIYSLGAVFIHDDGEESFAFPLIGRQPSVYDLQNLTVVTGTPGLNQVAIEDVKHLEGKQGELIPRYKIFNTAQGDGIMAYHQSETGTYPLTKNCKNDYIFGNLAGQPIRHHKFPSRAQIPLWEDDKVNLLGIKVENITYPADDIVGHYIVAARRGDFNRTVVDKGYTVKKRTDVNIFVRPGEDFTEGMYGRNFQHDIGAGTQDTKYHQILRPNRLFLKSYNTAEYLKLEGKIIYPDGISAHEITTRKYDIEDLNDGHTLVASSFDATLGEFSSQTEKNRPIDQRVIVDRNRSFIPYLDYNDIDRSRYGGSLSYKPADNTFDVPVVNYNFLNDVEVLKLRDSLPDVDGFYEYLYTSFKVNRDVYSNVNSIIYYKTHTNPLTESDTSELYIGDCLISELTYQDADFALNDDDRVSIPTHCYTWGYSGLYIETPINMELRHGGIQEQFIEGNISADCSSGTYFKGYPDDPFKVRFKYMFINTTGEYQPLSAPCGEFYGYNQDYTVGFRGRAYLTPDTNFNYCDQCKNNFVNRIIWSAKSFTDEKVDNYRIFYTNDYTVVGTNPITSIHYERNRLLVTSTDQAFVMSPNPRVMKSDVDNVYLSSGDFLSIPAKNIVTKNIGYGGNQGRFNSVASEFGYTYVDQEYGEIYNFGEGLNNISNKGMRIWFRNNLPFALIKDCPSFPHIDNIANGIGLIAGFDPKFKRYILHKRDYKPIASLWGGEITGLTFFDLGKMYYDVGTDQFFVLGINQRIPIQLGDPRYFENKSWTISYSYLQQAWTSFHSYMPDQMYNDVNNLYTIKGRNIWKHVNTNFLSYYGSKKPFMVEYINVTPFSSDMDTLEWGSDARVYNPTTGQWKYYRGITFNKVHIYNDEQSTGEITLRYLDKSTHPYGHGVGLKPLERSVILDKETYRITNLRDISEGSPKNTSQWTAKQQVFSDYGYIDKVPNDAVLKSNQYKMSDMTGTHNHVRFTYIPDDKDIQLALDMVSTKNFNQDE